MEIKFFLKKMLHYEKSLMINFFFIAPNSANEVLPIEVCK